MKTIVEGIVRPGAGRGRQLGVPTANLAVKKNIKLAHGIYAGRALVRWRWYAAAISWGAAPVFGVVEPKFEVHLLDFPDQDIVGAVVRVEVIKRLRAIKKFATVEGLKRALIQDIARTRKLCSQALFNSEGSSPASKKVKRLRR